MPAGAWMILNYSAMPRSSTVFVLVYYPDTERPAGMGRRQRHSGQRHANLQLLERTNGYCRTCAPPAMTTDEPDRHLDTESDAGTGSNTARPVAPRRSRSTTLAAAASAAATTRSRRYRCRRASSRERAAAALVVAAFRVPKNSSLFRSFRVIRFYPLLSASRLCSKCLRRE